MCVFLVQTTLPNTWETMKEFWPRWKHSTFPSSKPWTSLKRYVCVCVSVCDSVSLIRSELLWLGQGFILHMYLEWLGSAARKCIASMNVYPKIQGTTILPYLFHSNDRSRLSGGLIALEDRPQGHFNVVLDSLV